MGIFSGGSILTIFGFFFYYYYLFFKIIFLKELCDLSSRRPHKYGLDPNGLGTHNSRYPTTFYAADLTSKAQKMVPPARADHVSTFSRKTPNNLL
jgi:hypothetical protein